MNMNDLRELSATHDITSVVLYCTRLGEFEIYAYGDEDTAADINHLGNRINDSRNKAKIYTSLDRAYRVIREAGFTGLITIDG